MASSTTGYATHFDSECNEFFTSGSPASALAASAGSAPLNASNVRKLPRAKIVDA